MGGGLVDADTLVEELVTDMSKSGRMAYRPREVVELVTMAANRIFAWGREKEQFPIGCPARMKVIAGKAPRRAAEVRRGQG